MVTRTILSFFSCVFDLVCLFLITIDLNLYSSHFENAATEVLKWLFVVVVVVVVSRAACSLGLDWSLTPQSAVSWVRWNVTLRSFLF